MSERHSLRNKVLGVGLVLSMGTVGCSGVTQSKESEATTSTTATEQTAKTEDLSARGNEMWGEALFDMRDKITAGQSLTLYVQYNDCVAWPTQTEGVYAVIKNPALYVYDKGTEEVGFFPFVSVQPDAPLVMNGPYTYLPDSEGTSSYGNLQALAGGSRLAAMKQVITTVTVHQDENPNPFSEGWLLAADGTKISQTKLVELKDLPTVFDGTCDITAADLGITTS